MTRITRHRLAALVLLALGPVALAGCDHDEGPLERVGESLDESVEGLGDAVEDATDR